MNAYEEEEEQEAFVEVPLSCYTEDLKAQLNNKKGNGEHLKSQRSFVLTIQPCPLEVFIVSINRCDFQNSDKVKGAYVTADPKKLNTILGCGWERHNVKTGNQPDGYLELDRRIRTPITLSFDNTKMKLSITLHFILHNENGIKVG